MVAVAYKRWSFTRGSNCKAFTDKSLVFWIGGLLWEVVAYRWWSSTRSSNCKAFTGKILVFCPAGRFLCQYLWKAVIIKFYSILLLIGCASTRKLLSHTKKLHTSFHSLLPIAWEYMTTTDEQTESLSDMLNSYKLSSLTYAIFHRCRE